MPDGNSWSPAIVIASTLDPSVMEKLWNEWPITSWYSSTQFDFKTSENSISRCLSASSQILPAVIDSSRYLTQISLLILICSDVACSSLSSMETKMFYSQCLQDLQIGQFVDTYRGEIITCEEADRPRLCIRRNSIETRHSSSLSILESYLESILRAWSREP